MIINYLHDKGAARFHGQKRSIVNSVEVTFKPSGSERVTSRGFRYCRQVSKLRDVNSFTQYRLGIVREKRSSSKLQG